MQLFISWVSSERTSSFGYSEVKACIVVVFFCFFNSWRQFGVVIPENDRKLVAENGIDSLYIIYHLAILYQTVPYLTGFIAFASLTDLRRDLEKEVMLDLIGKEIFFSIPNF